ncbi:thioredoxin family protein [Algoriphagus sediminis]|uniref:Thioredoxin family protein n=1 Tax=Algoriphagus sediminis TaxID=3057113 RepID=A0ABT7Y810_9BACT|nr:thioredoxin family protein [Algoriphagus sediminis]MDN3202657.1 thioredoxin family protein [Algoriphagus sediminis]
METLIRMDIKAAFEAGYSYQEFKDLTDQLLAENRTTGPNQSETYIEYTRLNQRRMRRWDKTVKISDSLKEAIMRISEEQRWLIITEAWCGDGAQNIPFIQKLADLNPRVKTSYIMRDEYPEIMDEYLTNGARSIPKLIAFDKDFEKDFFTWGPRPEFLQNRLREYKIDPKGVSSKEFAEGTHLWYARDKNKSIDAEFLGLISNL